MKNPKTTSSNHNPFQNTVDLYPSLQSKFNTDAQKALAVQTRNMIHQYNEAKSDRSYLYNLIELAALLGIKSAQNNPCEWIRKFSIVQCFGFRCRPDQADEAADRLIFAINHMATSGWINASLYNLGMIKLGKHYADDPDMVCVVSYLAVIADHEAAVKAYAGPLLFAEGGTPMEFK